MATARTKCTGRQEGKGRKVGLKARLTPPYGEIRGLISDFLISSVSQTKTPTINQSARNEIGRMTDTTLVTDCRKRRYIALHLGQLRL